MAVWAQTKSHQNNEKQKLKITAKNLIILIPPTLCLLNGCIIVHVLNQSG